MSSDIMHKDIGLVLALILAGCQEAQLLQRFASTPWGWSSWLNLWWCIVGWRCRTCCGCTICPWSWWWSDGWYGELAVIINSLEGDARIFYPISSLSCYIVIIWFYHIMTSFLLFQWLGSNNWDNRHAKHNHFRYSIWRYTRQIVHC